MLLLTLAEHVVPPLPAAPLEKAINRQGLHTLLADRTLNLQKMPFAQETGWACAPPLAHLIRRTLAESPQNPQQGGRSVSECTCIAM